MAGLLDMYVCCGNEQALGMVQKMADWTAGYYTGSLSYEHMQRVLGTEFGGMGEVLSNLYAVTLKSRSASIKNHSSIRWPLIAMNSRVRASTRTFRK